MSTTLPLYWNLSSPVKEERIDASVKLVGALQEFQSHYIPAVARPGKSSDSEPSEELAEVRFKEIENDIDVLNAEDVRYAIRRLVRGLASPRESSRLGFAVALTEVRKDTLHLVFHSLTKERKLLARLNTVSSPQIISLIVHSTQIHGSMQGHEVRDQIFARLFGLVSVIQSGLLWRESTLSTPQSSRILVSTLGNFQTACNELLSLGERKSWLRESCWWALGLVVDGLETARVPWKAEALGWILEKVFAENKTWTPEKLAFALNVERMDLPLSWKDLLAPTFKGAHLLATGNLPTVARILRVKYLFSVELAFTERLIQEAPLDDEGDHRSKSSGAWKPQVHYVWDAILKAYFSSNASKLAGRASFQDFFRVAVDGVYAVTVGPIHPA
jgi:DNA polymerase phi